MATIGDPREWCPICEVPAPSTRKLSQHMKEAHNRLILTKDINAQDERCRMKARLAELEAEVA